MRQVGGPSIEATSLSAPNRADDPGYGEARRIDWGWSFPALPRARYVRTTQ